MKDDHRNNLSALNIGLMLYGRTRWHEAEATRKDFNYVLIRQDKKFFISDLFKVIQRNPIDPELQDNVLIPDNFFDYIYHIGCAINLHPITKSGFVAGGQNLGRERQTVFFTSVDPMNKEYRDPVKIEFNAPRLAWYKQKTWKRHQDTVYWVDIKLAQRKGLKVYQTRSNAIVLDDTLPAYCIPKVVVMESEKLYARKFLCHLDYHQRFPSMIIG